MGPSSSYLVQLALASGSGWQWLVCVKVRAAPQWQEALIAQRDYTASEWAMQASVGTQEERQCMREEKPGMESRICILDLLRTVNNMFSIISFHYHAI